MKRYKVLSLLVIAILLPMIIVLTYFSPISEASSFSYSYSSLGSPPFVTNIDGRQTEVYCSQAGGALWSRFGTITFYSQETHSMSAGLAYALRQCSSIYSRQNLIWMSEIADNITTPTWKTDYDDAEIQFNKIAGFNDYYNKLQQYGTEVKFEDSEAQLQSSDNGVFKLGPFKLNFYKSSYSGLSRMYMQTDDGRQIEVKQVNFGGYTGNVSDIDSGEEFYVLLSEQDAGQASKVKLVAEYHYTEASGSYTYYKPDKAHQTMYGKTVQRLVTINYTGDNKTTVDEGPEIELTIDLAGKVFKDKVANKDGSEDGILSTGDEMLEGIEVTLFDSEGNQIAQTTTDSNGYYEFLDQPASKQYYVRFKYNGQLYEPTTYQRVSKIIDEAGTLGPTSIAERSYATDGKQNRQDFNNKFTPVDSSHTVPDRNDTTNPEFDIYSYTGPNGMEELKYYGVSNSKEELTNINFGIKDREQFDMNLRKDLVKVDVSINGKSHTYQYTGGDQDLEVNIRGTDIPDYERSIRSSDLMYKQAENYTQGNEDKLQVVVTYKIQLRNQSVGKISGYITDLTDYYDTSYEFIRSYDENETEVTWEQSSDTGKYHTMHTTALSEEGITDKKWIFVEYRVSADALRALLDEKESTKENFAQISGYRNTYTEDRKDLNGQQISSAGENAGLIDIDSTPANLDPNSSEVQNFVAESKTDEYQNLDGEDKTARSMAVFEDDADSAPGLKLILDDTNKRRMTGTVFEDSALAERLEQDNERIGDGIYSDNENKVNQVKVELICTNSNVGTKETRTNEDGSYEFTDYIPGDYTIKFTYGDYESLVAKQPNDEMYTGQDYKSTIYTENNYSDSHWYNNNVDTRNNDAKDQQDRRQTVNSYSEDLKNRKATILNETREEVENNGKDNDELAKNTWMDANTAQMSMEVEYVGQEKTEYLAKNIDFGIIERPRSDLDVEKTVTNFKLTSAGDGQTIFDTTQSVSNLTWMPNTRTTRGLVQATVDQNLVHGATLELTFGIKVINTGETDYKDESYYNTGVVSDPNTIVTLKPEIVADYISNNLVFDLNSNTGWQEVTDKSQLTSGDDPYIKPVNEDAFNGLQKVIISTEDNPITKSDPLVPEKAKDKAGKSSETQSANVYVTKVLASDENNQEDTEYENAAEVLESTNANGRRTYNSDIVSIPGNFNTDEPDLGLSEKITIVPPFGAADVIKYTVIAIALVAILGLGIYVIKRKVLRK